MDIFSVDFTHNELAFIRQSLDIVTVSGRDAKFLASLQIKLENELAEIVRMKEEEEVKKVQALQELQIQDVEKQSGKRKS